MKRLFLWRFWFLSFLVVVTHPLFAANYMVPAGNNALIGEVLHTAAARGETTANIAQRYDLGVNAMISANPGVRENMTFSNSTYLRIPTQFLLPPLPRRGIVINLPEMRMYYFPEGSGTVMTFPIGIGKIGKTIPITNTAIVRKVINPVWTPTPSIREFNREQGIELPARMGPGPDNPLGPFAIYLGVPTYLIHSTIFPESIGRRASFGCIRMNENDIKEFFPLVKPGTPVTIVDMPNKIGWHGDRLFLEAHQPLEERDTSYSASLNAVVDQIQSLTAHQHVFVDWQLVSFITKQPDGMPHEIGYRLN